MYSFMLVAWDKTIYQEEKYYYFINLAPQEKDPRVAIGPHGIVWR